jgi:Ca2+-binding RTX toxin-like protein
MIEAGRHRQRDPPKRASRIVLPTPQRAAISARLCRTSCALRSIPGVRRDHRANTTNRIRSADNRRWGRVLVPLTLALSVGVVDSAAAEILVGTPGRDRLVAKSAQGDVLVGGGGHDTLIGGPGNDQFYGVRSGNTFRAGVGSNVIEGGTGDDDVTAGDGANTIHTGSGHDRIEVGNGNNYIDVGGGPDTLVAGHGNNLVHTGSGGGSYRVGNGNNLIFFGSGPAEIIAGIGINQIFINTGSKPKLVDCGGNPQSVLYINPKNEKGGGGHLGAIKKGQIRNCPNIVAQPTPAGSAKGVQKIARGFSDYNLRGTADGNDTLLGSHGSGTIDGRGGDNVIWADHLKESGGKRARRAKSEITVANGNNTIYGGRGSVTVTAGSGNNVIRGAEGDTRITTRGGNQVIRLRGSGSNRVTLRGGHGYVESFTSGKRRPVIRCVKGAKGTVVWGRVKPRTNCRERSSAYSEKGRKLQVKGLVRVPDSVTAFEGRPKPGDNGVGVPRPALVGG